MLLGLIGISLLTITAWVIAYGIRDWRENARFMRAAARETWLIAQHRRGWREYSENNLVRCLNPEIRTIWRGSSEYRRLRSLVLSLQPGHTIPPRPFVVRFGDRILEIVPLQAKLLEMRRFGRRSQEALRETRRRLASIDSGLIDHGSENPRTADSMATDNERRQ